MSPTPYLIHTNRELGLMLSGKKPLAYFVDGQGSFPPALKRYFRLFDRHVAVGRIIRSDRFSPNVWTDVKVDRWHHVFFALPGEEHRIDSMWDLKSKHEPWTAKDERQEGMLLGYTPEQCDWWLAHRESIR